MVRFFLMIKSRECKIHLHMTLEDKIIEYMLSSLPEELRKTIAASYGYGLSFRKTLYFYEIAFNSQIYIYYSTFSKKTQYIFVRYIYTKRKRFKFFVLYISPKQHKNAL